MSRFDLSYVKYLPEVGSPVLSDREYVNDLFENAQRLLDKAIQAKAEFEKNIESLWTAEEIAEAKDAAEENAKEVGAVFGFTDDEVMSMLKEF